MEKIEKIISDIPNDAIPVILIPYTYNPTESFKRSAKIAAYLVKKGKFPFSPILHTHAFDVLLNHPNIDYYQWDFAVYDAIKNPYFIFTYDWERSKGCREEMKWVKSKKFPFVIIDDREITDSSF